MDAIARLQRDHAILRAKLDVLEAMLSMGPDAWLILRELCFTLARQLANHIKREEALVSACRASVEPHLLSRLEVEHRDEPAHLHTINRLFVDVPHRSLTQIIPPLTRVIDGLRQHMAEEEAALFPILQHVLAHAPAAAPEERRWLDETMTVNRVLQEFPHTRPVFDRLFISATLEGCTCLDEVAWRHGMEVAELLALLTAAISPSPSFSSEPPTPPTRCGCPSDN